MQVIFKMNLGIEEDKVLFYQLVKTMKGEALETAIKETAKESTKKADIPKKEKPDVKKCSFEDFAHYVKDNNDANESDIRFLAKKFIKLFDKATFLEIAEGQAIADIPKEEYTPLTKKLEKHVEENSI